VPFQKSTEILYYNADALHELKVEVPTTWDELWDVCRLAKKKWPKCIPLGYDSESNWFITMCEQNGWGYTSAQNPHYLFNNAQTQAWLTELNGYFNEGLFTTQEIYGAYSSNLFTKGAETGSILSIGSSGGASYQDPGTKFDWGVAPIPGSKLADGTVVKKAISQGPSLVMFETSATNADEKQLMTWEFVKFLLDPQYQCKFAGTSGYMPARISAYEVPYYQELLEDTTNIVVATVLCAKTMTDNYYTSPAFVGSSTARTQVGAALQYAVMGTKSATAALADAAKKCGA
jgi:multiple sugar transport system substrate-binding protein